MKMMMYHWSTSCGHNFAPAPRLSACLSPWDTYPNPSESDESY